MNETRASIARKVRELRQARHWTQAELARRLGLSQGRLSEIERGGGSFTAEQFLLILKLFNVGASHFSTKSHDHESELQKTLARLGADHLQENINVLPSEQLATVSDAVREALVTGSPRLLTSLAPVLVRNVDRVNLHRLRSDVAGLGLTRRLDWLLDNTAEALRRELAQSLPRVWAQRYRRALLMLETTLEFVEGQQHGTSALAATSQPVDILEPHIRSKQTLTETSSASSSISRRWGVASGLHPEDFVEALRSARAG